MIRNLLFIIMLTITTTFNVSKANDIKKYYKKGTSIVKKGTKVIKKTMKYSLESLEDISKEFLDIHQRVFIENIKLAKVSLKVLKKTTKELNKVTKNYTKTIKNVSKKVVSELDRTRNRVKNEIKRDYKRTEKSSKKRLKKVKKNAKRLKSELKREISDVNDFLEEAGEDLTKLHGELIEETGELAKKSLKPLTNNIKPLKKIDELIDRTVKIEKTIGSHTFNSLDVDANLKVDTYRKSYNEIHKEVIETVREAQKLKNGVLEDIGEEVVSKVSGDAAKWLKKYIEYDEKTLGFVAGATEFNNMARTTMVAIATVYSGGNPAAIAAANLIADVVILEKKLTPEDVVKTIAIAYTAGALTQGVSSAYQPITENLTKDALGVIVEGDSYRTSDFATTVLTSVAGQQLGSSGQNYTDQVFSSMTKGAVNSGIDHTTHSVLEDNKLDMEDLFETMHEGAVNGAVNGAVTNSAFVKNAAQKLAEYQESISEMINTIGKDDRELYQNKVSELSQEEFESQTDELVDNGSEFEQLVAKMTGKPFSKLSPEDLTDSNLQMMILNHPKETQSMIDFMIKVDPQYRETLGSIESSDSALTSKKATPVTQLKKIAVLKHALKKNTLMYASRNPASYVAIVLGTLAVMAPLIYKIKKHSDRDDEVLREMDDFDNSSKTGIIAAARKQKHANDLHNKRVKVRNQEAIEITTTTYKVITKILNPSTISKNVKEGVETLAVDILEDQLKDGDGNDD